MEGVKLGITYFYLNFTPNLPLSTPNFTPDPHLYTPISLLIYHSLHPYFTPKPPNPSLHPIPIPHPITVPTLAFTPILTTVGMLQRLFFHPFSTSKIPLLFIFFLQGQKRGWLLVPRWPGCCWQRARTRNHAQFRNSSGLPRRLS